MKFILLFEEKEGTSPLVRLLDATSEVSVLHQAEDRGWEPFDRHNTGSMSIDRLEECLQLVFGNDPIDFEKLNRIYTQTSAAQLHPIDSANQQVVGFKMRMRYESVTNPITRLLLSGKARKFRSMLVDVLRRNNVLVFIAARQDCMRWALSKYHGDGSGKRGHLQFALASGKIKKSSLKKIHVDPTKLERLISQCEESHKKKYELAKLLVSHDIKTEVVLYEDFIKDKAQVLRAMLESLQVTEIDSKVSEALMAGPVYSKVHSDDISEFVLNSGEIEEMFGKRYFDWNSIWGGT